VIEILEAPDTVIALRTSGKLTGDDYDGIIAVIDERLSRHKRIGVVAEMADFHGLTGEALWKDLQYNLKRIGEWNRFPRCAVVTDAAWLKAMTAFWSPLIPGVEMKSFPPGQTAQAIAWAADL
jgi:hypothetical protein